MNTLTLAHTVWKGSATRITGTAGASSQSEQ